MNKTTLTAIVTAAVALVIGVFALTRVPVVGPVGPVGPQGVQGERGTQGPVGPRGVTGADASRTLGAVSTLDGVQFPYISVNGLRQYWYRQQTIATSSVACSVLNPFGTTTALTSFKVKGWNRMGAQLVDVSTSTTAYGTSSPAFIKAATLPAGRVDLVWGGPAATTTNANTIGLSQTVMGASDVFIRGNEYVNVKISTSSAGTFGNGYLIGECAGVFQL